MNQRSAEKMAYRATRTLCDVLILTQRKGKTPMKSSIASLLVIVLLALLLVSCGQSSPGQQAAVPIVGPTKHATSTSLQGRIAWQGFLDQNQTTAAIFSANAEGTNVRQLTHPNHGVQDSFPDWSPDGSKIIFDRESPSSDAIFIMNADGTGLIEVGSDTCTGACLGNSDPSWSPDGSKILFEQAEGPILPSDIATQVGLWVMNADGTHPVQLTQLQTPTSSEDSQPAWSPDGKRIVFTRINTTAEHFNEQALFIISRDGTGLKQMTSWELAAGGAQWSPDGKRILFQSFGSFPDGSTPQLYTIFPDGTHLVQLTTNERNSWPAWSPDGTKIIFVHRATTGQDLNAHLYEMNADGGGLIQITWNDLWQLQPAWGPRP
jgi:TolB protein